MKPLSDHPGSPEQPSADARANPEERPNVMGEQREPSAEAIKVLRMERDWLLGAWAAAVGIPQAEAEAEMLKWSDKWRDLAVDRPLPESREPSEEAQAELHAQIAQMIGETGASSIDKRYMAWRILRLVKGNEPSAEPRPSSDALASGSDGERCPYCGGCPQCCNEGHILNPDRDPDTDEYDVIPCPTCDGKGLPKRVVTPLPDEGLREEADAVRTLIEVEVGGNLISPKHATLHRAYNKLAALDSKEEE